MKVAVLQQSIVGKRKVWLCFFFFFLSEHLGRLGGTLIFTPGRPRIPRDFLHYDSGQQARVGGAVVCEVQVETRSWCTCHFTIVFHWSCSYSCWLQVIIDRPVSLISCNGSKSHDVSIKKKMLSLKMDLKKFSFHWIKILKNCNAINCI